MHYYRVMEDLQGQAIPFCKKAALTLTGGTTGQFEGIQSFRRIGVGTRNPANLPDAADRAALEEFLQEWSRESPRPTGRLREVKTDGQCMMPRGAQIHAQGKKGGTESPACQ